MRTFVLGNDVKVQVAGVNPDLVKITEADPAFNIIVIVKVVEAAAAVVAVAVVAVAVVALTVVTVVKVTASGIGTVRAINRRKAPYRRTGNYYSLE